MTIFAIDTSTVESKTITITTITTIFEYSIDDRSTAIITITIEEAVGFDMRWLLPKEGWYFGVGWMLLFLGPRSAE